MVDRLRRQHLPRRGRRGVHLVALLALLLTLPRCDASLPYVVSGCVRGDLDGHSVARVWDEQVLELIRQVVPAPTEHARNLFHMSAAMWDAWAAYDPDADGLFVTEKLQAADRQAAREAAISFAAYRILLWRYSRVADLATAKEQLDATMATLCYRTEDTTTEGDSPSALGNRIAATVIEAGLHDGSLEQERYVDDSYRPLNEPMVVKEPGTVMRDPNRWQPLSIGQQLSQNGLPIPGNVQVFIGSQWGHVTSFALPASAQGTPIDPGSPPRLADPATDAAFKQAAIDVIRYSSELDASDGRVIDIGPRSSGHNTLGTNDGSGYPTNPVTGAPYDPDRVLQADFGRVIAEFWADGPTSETPPGHWNVIANYVSDSPDVEHRIGGQGPVVDRLEWDVKVYLALNGAAHDAAIAAWGVKSFYDSVRPISMIRYMGGLGQSSDPSGPSYDPEGLPLVPGLVEVVTAESSAPGQRHDGLAAHIDEVAILAWRGNPTDPKTQVSGVGWIRAVEWAPYQRPTFVTPSFAGYVSGHSAFSRAGAEILAAVTGSPFFPGGMGTWSIGAGSLLHEDGPTQDVILQWATYFDASDQAGISRLWGGIHIAADDLPGREMGSICGTGAWVAALAHFDGSAR